MASQGDIRVLIVLDLALSFVFSWLVLSGLAFVDLTEFTWAKVGIATVALALITFMAVLNPN